MCNGIHNGDPIYIYTTTGFVLRKNKKMAGVDHFLVYIYIYIYTNCGIFTAVCIYTKKWSTQAIFLFCFSRPKPGGGLYIYVGSLAKAIDCSVSAIEEKCKLSIFPQFQL